MDFKYTILFFFFFIFFLSYASAKNVLFDNSHAQIAGNADWSIYGGYSDYANELWGKGYNVASLDNGPIKEEKLSNYDVLVIPEPNTVFSSEEQNAIVKFVENGKGLFLIGNHRGADRNNDGYDAVEIFNSFSFKFGIRFDNNKKKQDEVRDISQSEITNGVSMIGFWDGCTISGGNKLIFLDDGGAILVYSNYGNGRIVAIGDSAVFNDGRGSNGNNPNHNGFAYGDNARLGLNIIDWLAKGNDIKVKEWTVMVYMSQKKENDDAVPVDGYISDLQSVGSTSQVNFVILADKGGYGDTKAFYVTKDKSLKNIQLSDISSSFGNELNMGDALVARSFILYTIKNYPAKKYIQIYEGHAGGFGFSYDGESSDTLSISEMPDVFSPAVSAIGKRIDAVLIFGCLMGNIEFFYELAPFADFVGAAQTYSYPTPLREFGRILTSKYYADARSISRDLANAYGNSWFSYSYTVVDTSKMDEIMGPIDAYSLALLKYDKNELTELRDKAKEMAGGYPKYSSLREFYQFVQYTKEKDKLKESAEGVLSVIKNPIIAKTGSYNGFSIYFPKGEAHPEFTYDFNKYKRLRFSSKTHWDEFIENYMKEGVVYLQLGIPVDKLILINQSKAQHNFFIASRTYNGENPFVLMVKTKNEEDIKKFNIIVIMNSLAYMGGSKRYEWYYTSNNMNALVIIPKEQVNEKKNFEISVIVKGYPGEKIIYSIAAYAEFEKVDENNIEQIAWSGNIARKDGNLRKTNDEKYYFVLIPANKKINIKLNYIGTSNETDFDLYVGISPPHGMGLPRIYQFDYRGFTIDANETVPMKGSIGGYDKEVKIYILVRAYQGSGNYNLVIREIV